MHSIFLLFLLFLLFTGLSSGNLCLNKENILPSRDQNGIVPTPLILQRLTAIHQLISGLNSLAEEIYDPNFLFLEEEEVCYSSLKPTSQDKALNRLLQIQKNLFDLLPQEEHILASQEYMSFWSADCCTNCQHLPRTMCQRQLTLVHENGLWVNQGIGYQQIFNTGKCNGWSLCSFSPWWVEHYFFKTPISLTWPSSILGLLLA